MWLLTVPLFILLLSLWPRFQVCGYPGFLIWALSLVRTAIFFQTLEESGYSTRWCSSLLPQLTLQSYFWWQCPIWLRWFYLIPSNVVAFIVDPSGTICPSVFWLPAARLSGAVSLSSRRVAWRSEPSEKEALPGAEGCQRAARCGTLWRLLNSSIPKTLTPRESCRDSFFFFF